MTAPTLLEMRTRVRDRLRLSANDPMFTDQVVNRRINLAYGDVLSAVQPNGWWWQLIEQTQQNTTGADAAQFPVVLTTPDNTRAIRKVGSVFASLDGNYWLPIEPRERTDQVRLAGGRRTSDGLPLSWSPLWSPTTVAGVKRQLVIVFDTPLPATAWVRYQAVVDPADLTADGSVLSALPPILADLVVEAATNQLIRQRREVGVVTTRRRYATVLSIASRALDAWMKAARIYFNAPSAGPGYGILRDRQGP